MSRWALIMLMSLTPLFSYAGHPVSCGGFLDNTGREFMFDFFLSGARQSQGIQISVGKPHQFEAVAVFARHTKESTGFMTHKEILADEKGKFRLEWSAGLRNSDYSWKLTANFPEVGLVMNQQKIDCVGYY